MLRRVAMIAVLLGALFAAPGFAADNPTVTWNLSVWGPPRPFTAGIETLAKYLESETFRFALMSSSCRLCHAGQH
jgi:hypothetical protein